MLSLVASALLAQAISPNFAPPTDWARDFAPAGRFAMAGDVDGDGYADLICVSPGGDAFIDVALNHQAMKSVLPRRANSDWGKKCQAAVAGDFDGDGKTDVAGLFGGQIVRLASEFNRNKFSDTADWVKLPAKLEKPQIAWLEDHLFAWDDLSGKGYKIDPKTKQAEAIRLPKNVVSILPVSTARASAAIFTFADGRVAMADKAVNAPEGELGRCEPGTFPVVANAWIMVDEPAEGAPTFVIPRLKNSYPDSPANWAAADFDKDGDTDVIQFRHGRERHTGEVVLLHRFVSRNETDNDHDGIPNTEEEALGTDPMNPDTDNDGLPDGWEVGEFRGINFKEMGCDPTRIDVVVQISRYEDLDEKMSKEELARAQGYYESLGWKLHVIWLDPIKKDDQGGSWQSHQGDLHDSNLRGMVHWMQITPGGGGQANQLGDGGTCGGNGWTLYATFIHEFGHQLGLSHTGFYSPAWCPTYPSMMNYAYSYTLNGSIRNIRYSDGALADFTMNEANLDETLPLPYEKVKFLGDAPYRYRLKENGDTTLIDWNWNGEFGEKGVRADVNYSYSTTAGTRHTLDKTHSAPFIAVHEGAPYVLYAQHDYKKDKDIDPTVSKDRPGKLMLRRLIEEDKTKEIAVRHSYSVSGDPAAISFGGELVVAHPSPAGLVVRWLQVKNDQIVSDEGTIVEETQAVPSFVIYKGQLILLSWDPAYGTIRYRTLRRGHHFSYAGQLRDEEGLVRSKIPVGMAVDIEADNLILGLAQDQENKRNRWQIRRFVMEGDDLVQQGELDWVEGEKGNAAGSGRVTVLYDADARTGMKGRILFFSQGLTNSKQAWACNYVAQTIGDKSVGGGWMVKRFYDEWTESRSAPSACWFEGEILYAYRWVHGSQGDSDNNLQVSYQGTGIEDRVMGDFDDIGFMESFGIRHSILYLRR